MSEPSAEFTEFPRQVRKEKLSEFAESIEIKRPEKFSDLEFNYKTRLKNSPESQRLLQSIRSGFNDIVVTVQFAHPEAIFLGQADPDKLMILLGKRLPGRIYENTWAPIMGKIEEADIEELLADFPRANLKMLISDVSFRETTEEERFKSIAASVILARPYQDRDSGRIVHVAVKFAPEVVGLLEKERKAEITTEHSEFRWFRVGELPTDEMTDGTKKAIKNALIKLAEVQE